MFNLCVFENKQKESNKKQKEEKFFKKLEEKRKKNLPNLIENYDKRIKKFIYEMANSPIKIKDYMNPIETTRKEFLEEENEKIKGKRGFSFKQFKYEPYKPIYEPTCTPVISKSKEKNDETILIQPSMRYKARTDLERIFDVINKYNYGAANKKIIINQLKNLDLHGPHKLLKDDLLLGNLSEIFDQEQKKFNEKTETTDHINITTTTTKRMKRKQVDNSGAKNLMKDLYYKTHFKAASVYTVFKKSPRYKTKLPNSNGSSNDNSTIIKKNEGDNKGEIRQPYNKLRKNINPFRFIETSDENFMKYAYMNPFNEKEKRKSIVPEENLKYLRKISSLPHLGYEEKRKKTVKFVPQQQARISGSIQNQSISNSENVEETLKRKGKFKYNKDDEKIKIENEYIPKDDINLIAEKILRSCNFYHKKNKNNDICLKRDNGKLMQTMGLTISEFLEKTQLTSQRLKLAEKEKIDYSNILPKYNSIYY